MTKSHTKTPEELVTLSYSMTYWPTGHQVPEETQRVDAVGTPEEFCNHLLNLLRTQNVLVKIYNRGTYLGPWKVGGEKRENRAAGG